MPITSAVVVPHPPLIIPAVGRGEEKKIQPTTDAYREAMRFLLSHQPETVVICSPHAECYADYFHISPGEGAAGDFARFGAPQAGAAARYDAALREAIVQEAAAAELPMGTAGQRDAALDHATLIPLMFLQEAQRELAQRELAQCGLAQCGLAQCELAQCETPILRIGLSGLPLAEHYRAGQCIARAAEKLGRRVAVIASGDLSHRLKEDGPYGYRPEGPQLDGMITGALAKGDFAALLEIPDTLREQGAECGLGAIVMMAGALDGRAVEGRLLTYEDRFGVGYAVATMLPGEEDDTRRFVDAYEEKERKMIQQKQRGEDAYVRLARLAVESWVRLNRRPGVPANLPEEMTDRRAGVFVSLHKHGALRGCIGTIAPTTGSIAEEIIQNAISAAAKDPRFDPVRQKELDKLSIKVDVLGEPEEIDSMEQLDPERYGVIVSRGARRGLLLPDLDGVDTAKEQVEIARKKAGIGPDEAIQMERFEVVRHS